MVEGAVCRGLLRGQLRGQKAAVFGRGAHVRATWLRPLSTRRNRRARTVGANNASVRPLRELILHVVTRYNGAERQPAAPGAAEAPDRLSSTPGTAAPLSASQERVAECSASTDAWLAPATAAAAMAESSGAQAAPAQQQQQEGARRVVLFPVGSDDLSEVRPPACTHACMHPHAPAAHPNAPAAAAVARRKRTAVAACRCTQPGRLS